MTSRFTLKNNLTFCLLLVGLAGHTQVQAMTSHIKNSFNTIQFIAQYPSKMKKDFCFEEEKVTQSIKTDAYPYETLSDIGYYIQPVQRVVSFAGYLYFSLGKKTVLELPFITVANILPALGSLNVATIASHAVNCHWYTALVYASLARRAINSVSQRWHTFVIGHHQANGHLSLYSFNPHPLKWFVPKEHHAIVNTFTQYALNVALLGFFIMHAHQKNADWKWCLAQATGMTAGLFFLDPITISKPQ